MINEKMNLEPLRQRLGCDCTKEQARIALAALLALGCDGKALDEVEMDVWFKVLDCIKYHFNGYFTD